MVTHRLAGRRPRLTPFSIGLAVVGIAGMSILRELYSFVEHPLTYRL
jgi:hypothetical protein